MRLPGLAEDWVERFGPGREYVLHARNEKGHDPAQSLHGVVGLQTMPGRGSALVRPHAGASNIYVTELILNENISEQKRRQYSQRMFILSQKGRTITLQRSSFRDRVPAQQ